MQNNRVAFIQWTLRQAAQCPVRERIPIYRQLSLITGDEKESKRLRVLADSLEAADKACAEFAFNLELNGGSHAA